jgi:hypothetical protein
MARGLVFGTPNGPKLPGLGPPAAATSGDQVSRAQAHAADYGFCVTHAYDPTIVHVSGSEYHMHAKSSQVCDGYVAYHGIYTYLYRNDTYMAGDSVQGFPFASIQTDAWAACSDHNYYHT